MLRPPNVFTAIAEPLAGLAIVRGGDVSLADRGLFLVPASAAIYLGGLALNDFFDRAVDARERPDRPIPSGAVPAVLALLLGVGLLGAGLIFAALAGPRCLALAAPLALAVATYDAIPRGSAVAFLLMGACRALNFAMPLALFEEPNGIWLSPPLLLGAYVAALTYLARDEVQGNTQDRAKKGVVAMGIIAAITVGVVAALGPPVFAWIGVALLLYRWGTLFLPLWRSADGKRTGRAIGGGVLMIPLFDAVFVLSRGHFLWGVGVALLIVPALVLRRVYYVT
jgi:4-hydroxybenzoate polyprenyltransferase